MEHLILHIADRPTLDIIFSDAKKCDNVTIIKEKYELNNAFEKFLCRLHHSGRLNKILNIPGKTIWNTKSPLLSMKFDPEIEYYIVFLEAAAIQYSPYELELIKQYSNVHVCLLLFNPFDDVINLTEFKTLFENDEFEKIYAIFDENDILKRGFNRVSAIYSKQNMVSLTDTHSDCFFVGLAKDRQEELEEIYNVIQKNGYSCDFTIVKPKIRKDNGIKYAKAFIDYNVYLENVARANCIVEVLQGVQKGMTLRTFEAIVYGKHLLTNNSFIKENPFYNEKYMHYFKDINDIDFASLNLKEKADYGYDNEFSPMHLLEQIKEGFAGDYSE